MAFLLSTIGAQAAGAGQAGFLAHTPDASRGLPQAPELRQPALQQALAGTGASGLVLAAGNGRVLAAVGDVRGARTLPGSTLKPFVLLAALQAGLVGPDTVLPCRGTLMVGGRNLACTHPRALHAFTAETALAYSCNEYFANIATRMTPVQLLQSLTRFGLTSAVSSAAALSAPGTRVLLALGLAGVRVSVAQLAEAYRKLALELPAWAGATDVGQSPRSSLELVGRGLSGSVLFGMAYPAATPGIRIEGKTGTASEPGQPRSHGWFAGITYAMNGRPEQVVVLFVPRGSGGDAALLAHRFFEAGRGASR